jgi:cytochrome P450
MFQLLSSQHVMHHWEQYWSEPDKFEPDRFLKSPPKPYTYIPFFLGPRQCIGKNFAIMELKCMLCEILGRFEIERDPNSPWRQKSGQAVLCYPKENLYIFKPRL